MHPQSTPQNTADTPTMLSENAPLAELRLFLLAPLNRPQTPTKLVLNRVFQVDTNTDRHLANTEYQRRGGAQLVQKNCAV